MVYLNIGTRNEVRASKDFGAPSVGSLRVVLERSSTGDRYEFAWQQSSEDPLYATIAIDLSDKDIAIGEYAFLITSADSAHTYYRSVAQVGRYDDLYEEFTDNEINIIEYGRE